MNGGRVAFGSGLVALAVAPTPDDLTVVSPVLQLIAGSILIVTGLVEK